jgi:hypothetical protein
MSEAGETIAYPADRCESIRTLLRAARNDEAAGQYIERHGEDPTMLDALKVAYFYACCSPWRASKTRYTTWKSAWWSWALRTPLWVITSWPSMAMTVFA